MKEQLTRATVRFSLFAAIAVMVHILGPVSAASGQSPLAEGPALNKLLSRMMLPGTQDLQLIVQLTEPSVVEYMRAGTGGAIGQAPEPLSERPRMDLQSTQARVHRGRLADSQRRLIDTLLALPGARIEARLDTVMNAVIIRVPAEHYFRVRSLPGVKKVYFSRPKRLLLNTSAVIQDAQGLWNKAGGQSQAGHGIKIGIIDTGIDNTNPMLVDSSLVPPAGYPKGESSFTNSKVIVARNYVNLLPNRQSIQTAIDEVGHGTFVAGTAAGRQVTAPLATISGMAPGAFLGSYKIFGTPGINDGTNTAAIVAAVDAAVADGMDVLNLSLGGLDYLLPADDPEITALQAAVNSGIVVAVAAGNDGPASHTISNPGGMPDAISVGSVSNSRTFDNVLHVTAPAPVPSNLGSIPYLPGDGPFISANIPSTATVDVQTLDGNGLGCTSLPSNSLRGRIALIQRGTCFFSDKVGNAANAGATAVVVYNNDPSGAIIYMGGLTATSIPAVMIANADGLAVKNFAGAHPGALQMAIDNYQVLTQISTTPSIISSFSAVGPAPDFGIKPDLVAVGENIYSAALKNNPNALIYDPTGFTVSNGTSFSTPMVAGTAAGLKQLFPGLGALAIKSLITSTASRNLTSDGTNSPSVIQSGSGLLDMGSASGAGAVFSPTSLSYGVQSYSGSVSLTRTLSVKNILSSADQYSVSFESLIPGPTISFSQSNTGSVPPGTTASVDISMQITAPLSGGFQGFVDVTSAATSFTYHIPYWAGLYVPDSSRKLTVSQSSSGSTPFGNLADALNAANPGNIIEIADSGTYSVSSTGLTIATNAQGLPLHDITIRAAAGQTPTIDGSSLADTPTILLIGVQRVLLQGLTVTGGTGISTGILLVQPSPSVPLSATIDHCIITNANATAADSPVGIEVDGGGMVDVTQSTVSIAGGAGILANDGTYLTLLASTIKNNGSDGVDGVNANIQILNSTVSNNTGPGLNLDTCTGTIDGSTFASNLGPYGDGIELADGNFTITNNTFESNDRMGIGFFSSTNGAGATAYFSGNVAHANQDTGVYANPGQNLRIDGNLIKDNGRGIGLTNSTSALLVNNIIVRSTSTSFGNGVDVSAGSTVNIVNNTIYKNALQGIVVSGSSVSVFNSIISSNTRGDIQGLNPGTVQFSLVGDRTLPTGNNITGDPRLVNPDADIFDLSPGSPALDAGSNSADNLPFLDFTRRLRVSPAGAGVAPTGDGTVDMGAVESNSSYPLVFPLLANGNQPAFGDSYTTGIAVLNYASSASSTSFTAYNATGGLLGGSSDPALRSINPDAQIPILGYQLFGLDPASPSLGGVVVRSLQRMAGFFLLFDPDFKRLADGTSVSDQAATDLIFMKHEFDSAGTATYTLFNPGVNSASITANLLSSDGTVMDAPKTATIAPKGQFIFGFNAVTSSSGYVRVQSDRPISGLELDGNTQALAVMGAVSPGSEARLFFPHIAVNQGYTTLIGVVNSNSVAANLILTAYSDDGQVLGTPYSVSLQPNAQLLRAASDLFGIPSASLVTGYVIAQSDQAGVQGFTAYNYDDGIHKSSVAAPVDSVPRKHLLFSHIAHQVPAGSGGTYQTGIALLNPFGTTIDYTMQVFDGSGNLVAQKSDHIGPHQKVAKILSHPVAGAGFFTQPLPLSSGHIEVTTSYGLLGFELFFTEDLSQLASVPAQIGN